MCVCCVCAHAQAHECVYVYNCLVLCTGLYANVYLFVLIWLCFAFKGDHICQCVLSPVWVLFKCLYTHLHIIVRVCVCLRMHRCVRSAWMTAGVLLHAAASACACERVVGGVVVAVGGLAGRADNRVWVSRASTTTIFTMLIRSSARHTYTRVVQTHSHTYTHTHTQQAKNKMYKLVVILRCNRCCRHVPRPHDQQGCFLPV